MSVEEADDPLVAKISQVLSRKMLVSFLSLIATLELRRLIELTFFYHCVPTMWNNVDPSILLLEDDCSRTDDVTHQCHETKNGRH